MHRSNYILIKYSFLFCIEKPHYKDIIIIIYNLIVSSDILMAQ